jgi:uncharacterized protein
MREPYESLFPKLREEVERLLAGMPHCHGRDHTLRVWRNAAHLAEVEQADTAVVEYAAMLHDIGRLEEFATGGKTCHAELGAERTPDILRDIGVEDEAFIRHVADCVRSHRYRRRDTPPATPEARIVYDADKLDSIGAIGIGRAFHFAGRVGARVHNTEREALESEEYGTEDTAYREFLVKLRHIHETVLTAEGKRIAAERHRYMAAFFERLQQEVEADETGESPVLGSSDPAP